ncbi:protein of unknown function [Devosia crocina]|uniref:DUF4160 domain-containing protein n=1 Tax=Devosia crocina TaxID=429728 RepID=A0A1I7N5Z7_9HYPH|nr:DUF4160 domain-containing protein [Devosia crocina]SFV30061.1 protein of unknown function [Devosia crocina]
MPTIALFFGMVVQMYWRDHAPPHFHVFYQGYEGSIAIETGELIAGNLPKTAKRLLRDWTATHRTELLENWDRGRLQMPFNSIQGADYDD